MTNNAAFKKQVRWIASELGVPYAEARTRILRIAEEPLFLRPGLLIHPDPSVQPRTYLASPPGGPVSLDRIEGGVRGQMPPYTDEVCEALTRLSLVAAVRRHPSARSFTHSSVEPRTIYLAVQARNRADQNILRGVLYQAWLGNAGPAFELADHWRREIKAGSGWEWNIARAFGEDPGEPPQARRAPRQRRLNVSRATQEPFGDLSDWPRDEDGHPILLVEAEAGRTVSLLTAPCPYCGSQHIHSGSDGLTPGDNEGTRVPHCSPLPGVRRDDYALVVASPGQIVWPAQCQALTHSGVKCRKPTTRHGDGRKDVLCRMHRDDFEYRKPSEEPVRWAR